MAPLTPFGQTNAARRPKCLLAAAIVAGLLAWAADPIPSANAAQAAPHTAAQPTRPVSVTDIERAIVAHVEAHVEDGIRLLARTVDINSGTLNLAGVRRVADVLHPEFEALGFETRWVPLPPELNRAGHLIAERRGTRGKRLVLIGHLDTVFEEDSPFQRFERLNGTARGPGTADMKGGNIVILQALRALHAVGALEDVTITVVLTGDEESPGRPLEVSRRDLLEAARRSDVALGFEGGARDAEGPRAVVNRRSSSRWVLTTTGRRSHSSVVFSPDVGSGAIFEAARVIAAFHEELRGEEFLTFNVGTILGGSEQVVYDDGRSGGTAFGKTNVVPTRAVVHGDLRTLTDEQLERVRARMRDIVARNLPGTTAEIAFTDGYPSMPPTEGNHALLALYDEISRALGHGRARPYDPGARGAADISFVAPYVDGLDGLGPYGSGGHTEEETVDLTSLPEVTARAALMIYRLTRDAATP